MSKEVGYDSGKKIKGRKRHILIDRGSFISLKNECICSVSAVALGTFNFEPVFPFERTELKPDDMRQPLVYHLTLCS